MSLAEFLPAKSSEYEVLAERRERASLEEDHLDACQALLETARISIPTLWIYTHECKTRRSGEYRACLASDRGAAELTPPGSGDASHPLGADRSSESRRSLQSSLDQSPS
jgi:hypothetical protein